MISRAIDQKPILIVCGAVSVASAVFAYFVWTGPTQGNTERLAPAHKATRRAKNASTSYWLTGVNTKTR